MEIERNISYVDVKIFHINVAIIKDQHIEAFLRRLKYMKSFYRIIFFCFILLLLIIFLEVIRVNPCSIYAPCNNVRVFKGTKILAEIKRM